MFVIRPSQMAALRQVIHAPFVEQVTACLHRRWPHACAELGDERVRASVRQAIDRCVRLGIDTERDVVRFVNVMYFLGHGFDTDPSLPWAREILARPGISGTERLDAIYARILGTEEA
jgi:hypothetical protein